MAGRVLYVTERDAVVERERDERRTQSVGCQACLYTGAVAQRTQERGDLLSDVASTGALDQKRPELAAGRGVEKGLASVVGEGEHRRLVAGTAFAGDTEVGRDPGLRLTQRHRSGV